MGLRCPRLEQVVGDDREGGTTRQRPSGGVGLPSGIILASDMQNGLYVFDATDAVGVAELNTSSFDVVIFPNPFLESVIISTKYYKNSTYKITNIRGQVITSGNLSGSIETIQLNELPNGTYLIEISSENNKKITKKLVKSN
ncbi:MAG: T9SS type A sorting domain-containing protein [Flavobacteriales bacterium]|nr:T9SS type A sorting domain-containing protein [Flavobacteriales bacterium]